MVATRTNILLTLLCLAFSINTQAQTCGNCKEIPKIAAFDFDVQLPQPDSGNGNALLWPEWKNLFLLASAVSSKIANNEAGCLKITKPPSVDTGNVQLVSVGGETFTNLPSNPLISADLSVYGNYLLTGYIKGQGDACSMHVEVQASCNRKKVISADVSFSLSSLAGNVSNIAIQAANQLSPLSEKIRNFELAERLQNKSLSLFQTNWAVSIKITPQKKTLKAAESTPITIEVKDCDGFPLEGREIFFNETSFEGFKIAGTTGGAVSPARVVTGAGGIAKATFTLKAGAEYAIISAYSPGNDVKGCKSMFIGEAPINIKYNYSGFVSYQYESNANCQTETKDKIMQHNSSSIETRFLEYRASFFIDQEGSGGVYINFTNDEEDGNMVPNKMESGKFQYKKNDYWKSVIICECASKGEVTEQKLITSSNGELKTGQLDFSYSEGSGRLNLHLKFGVKTFFSFSNYTGTQSSSSDDETEWPVNFDTMMDKQFTIKKERSGNRTTYTIEGQRSFDAKCQHQSEKIKMVVVQE